MNKGFQAGGGLGFLHQFLDQLDGGENDP
jgi:hypothetical protein